MNIRYESIGNDKIISKIHYFTINYKELEKQHE